MAYKSSNWLYGRQLRKGKLGPPDLYPQDPKQKEVIYSSYLYTVIKTK